MSADVTSERTWHAYCRACRWTGPHRRYDHLADEDADQHDAQHHTTHRPEESPDE